jgi:hypothetical protein
MSAGTKPKASATFGNGMDASQMEQFAATRVQVLDRIHTGLKNKEGGNRMKGKVGIITGVGPATGIGVSRGLARMADTGADLTVERYPIDGSGGRQTSVPSRLYRPSKVVCHASSKRLSQHQGKTS